MIRLLQHYTPNFKPLIDISKPIHEAYCKKHGYSFHLKEVPQYEVYNGLEKLNQILEVCENGDIALVMDAFFFLLISLVLIIIGCFYA